MLVVDWLVRLQWRETADSEMLMEGVKYTILSFINHQLESLQLKLEPITPFYNIFGTRLQHYYI